MKTTQAMEKIAQWGEDNLLPQQMLHAEWCHPIITKVNGAKVDFLAGAGICYGPVEFHSPAGLQRIRPKRVNAIDTWLKRTKIVRYFLQATRDLYVHRNIFAEFTLDREYDRIIGLTCLPAFRVRLGQMNDQGKIEHAYIGNWSDPASEKVEIPVLDPYYQVAEQVLALKKPRCILPIRTLERDQYYYGKPQYGALDAAAYVEATHTAGKASCVEGPTPPTEEETEFIVCRDLGLKPSLIDVGPHKDVSKEAAISAHVIDEKPSADLILSPLEVVRDVNGWPKEFRFFFKSYVQAVEERINPTAQ